MTEFAIRLLPDKKGSYILSFKTIETVSVIVGSLGTFLLQPGIYHYFGSARGSGGVRARLRHHLSSTASPHWHLDFLRPHIQYLSVIYTLTSEPMECRFSKIIQTHPGAIIPIPGFGASDCRSGCAAHLVSAPITAADTIAMLQNRLEMGIRYNWVILDNLEVT